MGMTPDRDEVEVHCPVRATVRLLGGKYKAVIIWALTDGKKRFSEIQALVPEATGKMVTKQLRELEADGLVHREVYPVVPPRTEYSLTPLGESAVPVIVAMSEWGASYLEGTGVEPYRPEVTRRCPSTTTPRPRWAGPCSSSAGSTSPISCG